jgi:hypothetical protein
LFWGINFCNDIWLIVKKEIPKEKQKKIAMKIYKRFDEEYMDNLCGDTEIGKLLKGVLKF